MVEYIVWLFLCFVGGYLAGGLGDCLVASMALAASDAVTVGIIIGIVYCAILDFIYTFFVKSD